MTTEPPSALRTSSALGTGSLVSGLLGYVFFALVTRALGPAEAAPVAVLWAWWGFAAAGLTFPLQHWITHSVAVHAGEGAVRRALPAVAGFVVAVSVAVTVASWLARDLLFRDDGVVFPLLAGAVAIGSGVLGAVRGILTARRRFTAISVGLVAENALRCLAAGVLMALDSGTPATYGACLVVGYLAVLLWPGAAQVAGTGKRRTGDSPLAFVSGASAGQVIGQAVLTGGPVVLAAASGAPAEVTALFAGLALFRAPYTLALGLVSQLTERLTRLVVDEDLAALRRFDLAVLAVTLVTAAAAAVLGGWLGPPVMELVFGEGVRLEPSHAGLIAVGSVFALANLVLTVAVLAHHRPGALVGCWLLALAIGSVVFGLVVADSGALSSTCWSFLVAEAGAYAGLALVSAGRAGRQEHRRAER